MGGYMYPFAKGVGYISQPFGSNPNNGINPAGGHTGDDWAVPEGTPIHAAGDGIIELSGWPTANYLDSEYWLTSAAGDGLVLNCGDNAPTFIYGHNADTPLPVGTWVKKGDIIAISGNSGLSTGPHCHVEALPPGFIVNDSTYGRVNPRIYFDHYFEDQEDFMTEEQLKQYIHETNVFNQKTINARIGDVINEIRAHTAWNAAKVIDVVKTIPDVSDEVVKEIKEQLSAGFEFTVKPKE